MIKNRNERKKRKKKRKKTQKNIAKKNTTKNIIKKIQQKKERPKKMWVKGEEEPTEKYLSRVFAWIIQFSLHETL